MTAGYLLLVEDNPGDARLTMLLLEDGAAVDLPPLRWVKSIHEALDVLMAEQGCEAVLLDLGLPDVEGLDALNKLATAEQSVPIIIISGSNSESMCLDAISNGAQDYLVKGCFDAVSLRRTITFARKRKRAETIQVERALRDELTGLPRRTLLLDRLQTALRQTERSNTAGAILFIDLDGFKAVNDTYGHAAGDDVLIEVAKRLLNIMRASDTAARLGGDEFVALLPSISNPGDAKLVAEKILNSIEEPIPFNGTPLRVSASIGLVTFNGVNENATALMARADNAMYTAKSAGRGRVVELN